MESRTWTVSDTIEQLDADAWRNMHPFSPEMARCHSVLFDPSVTRRAKAEALTHWLAEHQPCLFGRIEARQDRLAFCLLTENDLVRSDEEIRSKIQHERLDWRRRASGGDSHAFLIVAVSEQIATARPNEKFHRLAARLCDLYLGLSNSDTIYHDSLILRIGDSEYREWKVGVNYFSAQGDGRWWRDHRIPGGIGFSMNSVGHMARTHVERKLNGSVDLSGKCAGLAREKLVYWALRKAMETIGPPTPNSSRGTCLAQRGTCPEDSEPPSFTERQHVFGGLASFSENRYRGLYHTDHTIPSSYFDEGLWRREDLEERSDLFFTYLHRLSDEAYRTMAIGMELLVEKTQSVDVAKGSAS